MTELKSCPFCGCGEAGTQWHYGYWSVTCGYMHDGTPSKHCFQDWGEFETEEEAIEAWNRRETAEIEVKALNKMCELNPIANGKYSFICPNCKKDLGIEREDIYVYDICLPKHCVECGQHLIGAK